MGHSKASKTESHERILKEASARLRLEGIDGFGIAKLMQAAGLTHGGFYKHFSSRAMLIEAALNLALTQGHTDAGGDIDTRKGRMGPEDIRKLARSYLSTSHRDAGEKACAISVLAGEVGRGREGYKAVMAPHIRLFLDGVSDALEDKDTAVLLASALVGAITLSRVLPPDQSEALLRSVRNKLLSLI